jgi:hypothetical protein
VHPAQEHEVELGEQLALGHVEATGDIGEGGAVVGHDPRHDREEQSEPLGGRPAGHQALNAVSQSTVA